MRARLGLVGLVVLVGLASCRAGAAATTPASAPWSATLIAPTLSPSRTPTTTAALLEPTPTLTPEPVPLERVVLSIPAPSLQDNLIGDPAEQYLEISLPPSYAASELRYPVVYFLPGFGSGSAGDNGYFDPLAVGTRMASGALQEMILVVPAGANRLGGSFYVNSAVTGKWEDYIVQDVVGYVDANYRTIRSPAGRGIGGHSMGGFGAINLAMRHPELFGTVYSLSPGLFDENGLADSQMFGDANKPKGNWQRLQKLNGLSQEAALQMMIDWDGAMGFTVAYGAAFAPNPALGPPYFDYPYRPVDGKMERIPEVWKRWQAGFGDWPAKITEYQANLEQLNGILIDYGLQDGFPWIPRGSEYLAGLLEQAGIDSAIVHFEGGHSDRIEQRLLEVGLPFFSQRLEGKR